VIVYDNRITLAIYKFFSGEFLCFGFFVLKFDNLILHSLPYFKSRGLTRATTFLSNFDGITQIVFRSSSLALFEKGPGHGKTGRGPGLPRKGLDSKGLTRIFPTS
jgi:hypothetical protein